ncbi:MAG TPA: hypothetical protein VKP30_08120 [Polyangiaceae bacterium]|nr:hypothetical protein [Polyangiaceae bacterium]
MLASNVAFADELCGDTTCQKGFVCQSYAIDKCSPGAREDVKPPAATGGTTSRPPVATDVGAAAPGDSNTEPVCESYTSYECVPAPCTVDTDCADGMVCHTYTTEMCSGTTTPACRAGDLECTVQPPEPPECTTTTNQQCVARYQLPCTVASDCGPGFTCEEQQTCWCSGSKPRSGTAADGSEGSIAEPVDPGSVDPPECGCAPTGTFQCRLQTIACGTDADCPSDLVCVENPSSACWASSDGTSGCTTPDPAKVCQPRYYRGGAGGVDVAPTPATGGQSSTTPTGTGAAAQGDDGELDGNDDADSDLPDQVRKHPHHLPGFGCTVATSSDLKHSGLASLLLGVGLALGIRRRRARK